MFLLCVVLNIFFICPSAQSSPLDFVHRAHWNVCFDENAEGSWKMLKSTWLRQKIRVCCSVASTCHSAQWKLAALFPLWLQRSFLPVMDQSDTLRLEMGLVITKTLNLQTDLLFKALLSSTAPVGYLLNAEGSIPPTDTHNLLLLVDCPSAVHVFLLILRCGCDLSLSLSVSLKNVSTRRRKIICLNFPPSLSPNMQSIDVRDASQMSAAARVDVIFSSVCFCLPGEVCENWLRLLDHRLLSLLFLYGKNT